MASQFVRELESLAATDDIPRVARFFRDDEASRTEGNQIMGVSIGKVFPVAKKYAHAPLDEVEELLESPYYEVRMGAVSIMDFQARAKSTADAHRKALFDLYIRRHDRINNWDLVDRSSPHVIGRYLIDKPRDVLYKLARSNNPCERRTAIVSTYAFIRSGDLDETFGIAEVLAADPHDLVQKAVGSWLREAGKRDPARLIRFLESHAAAMSQTCFRYATEKLDPSERSRLRR